METKTYRAIRHDVVRAKELNRKFIGIEKEVKYYDLAVARVFGQHCH